MAVISAMAEADRFAWRDFISIGRRHSVRSQAVGVLFAILLGACSAVHAETLVLKNADRLTGVIVHSDGSHVTIKTEYAGAISVPWSAVKELTSDKTLFVTTSDKKTVSGTIAMEGSTLVVHTASAEDVRVPLASVAIVRSTDEQTAYEKSLHPGLRENWTGGVNIGFALSRTENSTTNFSSAWNAERKTLGDHFAVHASSLYSRTSATGTNQVTANTILGGLRYDRNFSQRWFAFGIGDFSHDALQDLDLQSIYSFGLGLHVWNRPRTTLDVSGGGNYTREVYAGVAARNLAGGTAGEDFTHQVNKLVTLNEHFYFYPDFTNRGQYRFAFDGGSVTKISSWLGWQVTISDRFVSNPPILGVPRNSMIVSTGLNFSFGQ
jgi:Protein of unknown function, DUF481